MTNFSTEEYLEIAKIISDHGFEDVSESIKKNAAQGSSPFYGYITHTKHDKSKIKLHLTLSAYVQSIRLDTVYKQRSRDVEIKSVRGFMSSLKKMMDSFNKSEDDAENINSELKKKSDKLYTHWSSAFPEGAIKIRTMRLGANDCYIMSLEYKGFKLTLQESETHDINVCDNVVSLSPVELKRYLDSVAWVNEMKA